MCGLQRNSWTISKAYVSEIQGCLIPSSLPNRLNHSGNMERKKKKKKKGVSINPWQCISIDSSSQIQPSDCREEKGRIQVLPSRTLCPLREARFTNKTTLESMLVFPTRLQNLKVKDLPHICNISTLPWKKSIPSTISYRIKLWKCGEIGKDVLCKYLEKIMTIGRINISFVPPEWNDLLCNLGRRMPALQGWVAQES